MKIAFLGLPLAALLLEADGHELAYVGLCRLDSPGQRRAQLHFGDRLHLQPKLSDPVAVETIRQAQAPLLVSWFWTKRIPESVIKLFPMGGFGVHPSLLPRHRGPDPYFWAIDCGDTQTGVTAHRLAASYDTGDMLCKVEVPILPDWTAWDLARALDRPSLCVLRSTVQAFALGTPWPEHPQDERFATQAPFPDEEMWSLRMAQPTANILQRIRALAPQPGAWLSIGEHTLMISRARSTSTFVKNMLPGEGAVMDGLPILRTADGAIIPERGEMAGSELREHDFAQLIAAAHAQC
jgi:methionyl-tRNA formyltransferase